MGQVKERAGVMNTPKTPTASRFWKQRYVVATDADEVERRLQRTSFRSGGRQFELIYFEAGKTAPTVLISQGSGGHAYVFAELGYHLYLRGYNVCIMPKHGGVTIEELLPRHNDALEHIATQFNDRIGVFAEGLGGFVVFYLALTDSRMKSIVLQNAPAILTEEPFREAILQGKGAARRRKMILPFGKLLLRLVPWAPLPISSYLDWKELIDTKSGNREIETRLVVDGYLRDPDFDKWYPLSAIMSLLLTPPPHALSAIKIPTLFLVALRGFGGKAYVAYVKDLYRRLPPVKKRVVEVDGSVYWMLSHPKEAAQVIGEWFDETLSGKESV
jgi:pimeloyl-ACP methyl ester carboxylesterase